jgi:DNA-binding beta-propeller fold protein YncE
MKRLFHLAAIAAIASALPAQTVVNSWPTGSSFPGGLDYDPSTGTVWVVDSTDDAILQFDRNGVLLQSWVAGPPPGSTATTAMPIGCALDPATGNLWVADENEWCYELDPSGNWTGRGWSTSPAVIDVSSAAWDPVNGTIWISQDSGTRAAVEFDVNGVALQTVLLGGAGSVDPDGFGFHSVTRHLFLGEDTGDQIIEVDPAGGFVASWALAGLGISPEGIGLDEVNGKLFVADGFGGMVWELDGIITGGGGGPTLSVSNLVAGGVVNISVSSATPGGIVRHGYSLAGGGPINTAFGALLLSPPYTELPPMTANASGDASLSAPVPPGTTGVSVWLHAMDLGSMSFTNGLAEVIG